MVCGSRYITSSRAFGRSGCHEATWTLRKFLVRPPECPRTAPQQNIGRRPALHTSCSHCSQSPGSIQKNRSTLGHYDLHQRSIRVQNWRLIFWYPPRAPGYVYRGHAKGEHRILYSILRALLKPSYKIRVLVSSPDLFLTMALPVREDTKTRTPKFWIVIPLYGHRVGYSRLGPKEG